MSTCLKLRCLTQFTGPFKQYHFASISHISCRYLSSISSHPYRVSGCPKYHQHSHSNNHKWHYSTNMIYQIPLIGLMTTVPFISYKYFQCEASNGRRIKINSLQKQTNMKSFYDKYQSEENKFTTETALKMFKLCNKSNHKQTAKFFYSLYSKNPKTSNDYYGCLKYAGLTYFGFKDYFSALKMFKKLGEKRIIDNNLEFEMAFCSDTVGQIDEAIDFYHKFINNPQSVQFDFIGTYHNLFIIYYEIKEDYKNALEMLDKLGAKEIINRNFEWEYAFCLMQIKNDYNAAIDFYHIFLAKNASNTNAYKQIATCYNNLGDYEKALEYIMKISKDEIINMKQELFVASTYFLAQMYDQSLEYLNLVDINSLDFETQICVYCAKMLCYQKSKDEYHTILYAKQLLEIEQLPHNALLEIYDLLNELYKESEDYQRLLSDFKQSAEILADESIELKLFKQWVCDLEIHKNDQIYI